MAFATFTPAMLQTVVAERSLADCPNLGKVLVGGEALPAELAERFAAAPPVPFATGGAVRQARLHNRYGPTETTISVTSWACGPREPGRVVPIGRPIARTEIYVLDRDQQPVPVGVPGELAIGGPNLARGYLGSPRQTAVAFVPHPLAATPGARLYRSGDLVRYRPDGAIEFIGRIDGQVKVRGFRVELGEIEAWLSKHPAVERTAVVDRAEAATGSRRLVAYVVARRGEAATAAELRGFLAAKVPSYMVPSAFVLLDRLPLSPTGKVDRQALPEPTPERTGEDGDAGEEPAGGAPEGAVEERLAGLWRDLLPGRDPGRGDDFFALGGHSLLATRLVARLRADLGVELPLQTVFASPSLAEMAAAVTAVIPDPGTVAAAPAPPLRPLPRSGPPSSSLALGLALSFPLSFAQERLWFLEQLEPGRKAYHMAGALEMTGRLDRRAFAAALAGVVRRHEALRTTFAAVDGRPVQVIHPASPVAVPVPLVDLAALPAAARAAEAARRTREEALAPFDLGRGPLLRAVLLCLGADEHRALLTLHHIVSDGWSVGILARELAALYAGFLAGGADPAATLPTLQTLQTLPVQYADYAVWQRSWLAGPVLDAQLAWWAERLAGAPEVLELPLDRPRPAVASEAGGQVRALVPAAAAAALARLGRAHGATPFMTLLAAFAVLLGRTAGQDDVVVGTASANRTHREVEGLIGFFVNTLALRIDLAGDPAFTALLARVRQSALADFAHQELPFERLVGEVAAERSLAHSPLFQVTFLLQDAPAGRLELPGLTLAPRPVDLGAVKFDLGLAVDRVRRRPGVRLGLPRQPLRPGDRGALRGPFRDPGRRARGASGGPVLGAAAARSRRAPAAPRVERPVCGLPP